jgi:serine/threonine protein kinase
MSQANSDGAVLVWLDALAGGLCTPEAFLSAMRDHFHGDLDEGWRVLSLLDQYYRRGKIKPEIFHTLKSQLEGSALNADEEAAGRPRPRAAAPVTPVAPAADVTRTAPFAPAADVAPAAPAAPAAPTADVARAAPAAAAATPVTAAIPVTSITDAIPVVPVTAAVPVTAPAAASREAPAPVPRPAVRKIAAGDRLCSRYWIRGVLGHGGMGTVFDGVDEFRVDMPGAGQRVAIKVLPAAITRRRDLLTELQMEFQYLQSLSHPNIIRVHEFDRDGDIAFFTMEFLNGDSLGRVLSARNAIALPRPQALAIIRQIGAAICHAHSRGVVHGDINPQNVFITNDGELRVMDFGASHGLRRELSLAAREWAPRASVVTRSYASCQLLEGQHPDTRDDVFALACVAYELISGQHPFQMLAAVEAREQRLRPSRPRGLNGRQWRALREGLRWERERRPSDVQKWLDRLDLAGAAPRLPSLTALVELPAPRTRRPVRAAAAILMLVLLATFGIWAVTDYDSLEQHVVEWNQQARSTLENAGLWPSATAPVAADQPAPAAPTTTPSSLPRSSARAAPSALPRSSAPATTPSALPRSSAPATTPSALPRAAPGARATPAPPPVAALPPAPTPRQRAAAVAGSAGAGPARIEMAADTVEVQASNVTALVVVRRKGNLHGDASFTWWTESGTAKPGRDFTPVIPRVDRIPDGSSSVSLSVPVSGTPRTQPKSFYVVIDRTDSGAALGAKTLTMVTLQPPE